MKFIESRNGSLWHYFWDLEKLWNNISYLILNMVIIFLSWFFWIYLFPLMLLFVLQWLSLHWKFWPCSCLSFQWLSVKLKTGWPISSHSFWLFSCWSDGPHNQSRDVLWEDILKVNGSAAASEFWNWF